LTRTASTLAALAAVIAFSLPAQAASGKLDSFSASATEVPAGSWVDFSLAYSVFASAWSYGGSNTTEPEPQEGYQEWNVNWYQAETEAATSASLQIDSQSTTDFLSVPPGSSAAGRWTVSMYFADPGQYSVSAGGSWAGETETYFSHESAYRHCHASDPEGGGALLCDSWTWTHSDGSDRYSIGDAFAPLSLTIRVSAVPEPGTLALWAAGIGLLAACRRSRQPCGAVRAGEWRPSAPVT
jgi:PEP-CTERM motif